MQRNRNLTMTTEQKAMAYDEALKRAKESLNDGTITNNTISYIHFILPELKESEDEKIRKDLIEWFEEFPDTVWRGHHKKDIIAWLEKQGEQKPNITWNDTRVKQAPADKDILGWYRKSDGNLEGFPKMVYFCSDKEAEKETSLAYWIDLPNEEFNKTYWFEKQGEKKSIGWKQDNVEELTDFENAMMHIGNSFFGAYAGLDPNNTETIKEQANLLLDLVNVEWSEEDKSMLNNIIEYGYLNVDDLDWLRGLPKRFQLTKNNVEWGEEDNVYLEDALWAMKLASTVAQDENDIGNIWCAERWLKSLKERIQPKQEWSKEDENNILFLTSIIEECFKDKEKITLGGDTVCANFTKEDVIERLKSLRPHNGYNPYKEVVESIAEMCKHYDKASHSNLRDFYDNVKVKCKDAKEYDSLYPNSTWKPSKKQLDGIECAIKTLRHQLNLEDSRLDSLYNDLKKLREK